MFQVLTKQFSKQLPSRPSSSRDASSLDEHGSDREPHRIATGTAPTPRLFPLSAANTRLRMCETLAASSVLLFMPQIGCDAASAADLLPGPLAHSQHNSISIGISTSATTTSHASLSQPTPEPFLSALAAPSLTESGTTRGVGEHVAVESSKISGRPVMELAELVSSAAQPAVDMSKLSSTTGSNLPPIPTEFPPLPNIELPVFKEVALKNGLHVILLEDHEVSLVRGALIMKGGQYASPADKLGLASIATTVQRSGGSEQHPYEALNARLEDLSASIEAGAAAYASNVSFDCLSEDIDEVMGLFAEVVRQPAMPEERLKLVKQQVLNILDHAYDQPSLRPDEATLGIVGDFDTKSMTALVERVFGDWEAPPTAAFTKPNDTFPPQDAIAGKVFVIDKPGLTQASVVSGEPGVELNNPDTATLDVMGQIFGSFGGQLFNQIRTREGLAYSISGSWDTPPEHEGLFLASSGTSSPAELLTALRRVLGASRSELVPLEEVDRARARSLNSFVFNFASSASQMQRIIAYDLLGIPQDFLFQYQKAVASVSQEDIQAAAMKHLHPEKQTTVIVADAKEVMPKLRAAGFD
eukprot:gene23989-9565_t